MAGIYTGYHFGFEQKTKVYIVGAILFWAAGIDVIVDVYKRQVQRNRIRKVM